MKFQLFLSLILLCCGSVYGQVKTVEDEEDAPTAFIPWQKILEQPNEWFSSSQGEEMLENILSWQTPYGCWPKNVDTAAYRFIGNKSKLLNTIDNDATVGEIRILARAYTLTKQEKYKTAAEKAIADLLDNQYPSGGWPQRFPFNPRWYHRYITFNDSAMVNVLYLFQELPDSPDFAFLSPELQQKAAASLQKGIECILKCQIRIDDVLTGWCAQHDPETYQPREGRAFEPISISGIETANNLLFLMSLPNPSPEIVQSVEAGVKWLKENELFVKEETRGDDKVVVPTDPDDPYWATFYEIPTCKPIFSDRTSVIYYSLDQISHERRNGYRWYLRQGQRTLREYAKWKDAH